MMSGLNLINNVVGNQGKNRQVVVGVQKQMKHDGSFGLTKLNQSKAEMQ
jgi:hypothetical protein